VEAGKRADLVVVRGDPTRHLSDIRQVECVFQRGRLVARRGQLTGDARPLPWPADEIAERRSLWAAAG
jgi:cytosine/adenosine deaminase-related metal-dependent hydrolase